MPEQDGTQNAKKYRTRDLYAAALALIELGRSSKPQTQAVGQTQPPLIAPLPGTIALRFGYCRNSLTKIAETIEEAQRDVRVKHEVEIKQECDTPEKLQAWATRAEAAAMEIRELMESEREWHPPATVRIGQLLDRHLPDEWPAALLAVDIIVGEFPPDEPKDAKP